MGILDVDKEKKEIACEESVATIAVEWTWTRIDILSSM